MSGMMSDQQGGCCGDRGNAQGNDHRTTHAGLDEGLVVTTTLPETTNESCCSAGVGGDEVAGPDRSREVGGLGQVLPLVATRGHGCITTGCGCGPDVDASLSEEQGQAPLGVDARDGAPLDFVGRDDVSNVDPGFPNDQARTPESCVDDRYEESGNADSAKPVNEPACCGGGCCGTAENEDEHGGDYLAGAGRERDHGLHVVTEVAR